MPRPTPEHALQNRLLRMLPRKALERLLPRLEPIPLPQGQVLFSPHKGISHVYFPRSGVISLVERMADGSSVEVATVGNEGFIGVAVLLGASSVPLEAFVQVAGEGYRMTAKKFLEDLGGADGLCSIVQRYTQSLLNQVSQTAACNRLHSTEERCARWLLMIHDRAEQVEFPLTQEFLSEMLGVRRASVTTAASILQKAGFIRYSRGKVRIVDRKGLEAASCECYQVVRDEVDRLMR